ncbi:MAG: hypothetical protein CVV51_07875 [Spirochaetae bacterium HGW-Spirochaetae-7]|nr:MAG: hypothetical protein CVV51_07875 [Spirochaetae bacterium HGW-Spirochaetae-7]
MTRALSTDTAVGQILNEGADRGNVQDAAYGTPTAKNRQARRIYKKQAMFLGTLDLAIRN